MSSPHFDLIPPQTRLADLVTTPTRKKEEESFIQQADSYNLVKISLFILGIGVEISPNALLLCARYYYEEYPNLAELIYYILPVYSISNIIFTLLIIRTKWVTKLSFTFRIIISFILSAITLFGLVQSNQTWDFLILLLIVFIIGMTSAILDRSILGFSNILEQSYKHIFISGEALSGVIATIIRVITRICYSNNVIHSSNTYFITIATYCIVCSILFTIIRFTNYVAFRLNIYILYIAQYKPIQNNIHQQLLQDQQKCEFNENNNNDDEEYLNQSSLSNINSQTSDEQLQQLSINTTTSSIDDDIIVSKRQSSTIEQYEKMDLQSNSTQTTNAEIDELDHMTHRIINIPNNSAMDITNFLSSLHYKPNNNNSMPIPYQYRKIEKSDRKRKTYSSLLFNDINSNRFEISLIKRIKMYCFIILLSNILTWTIIPGLICGEIKSNLSVIAKNDWESILLMSEYFISQYIGRLIISQPGFWWCCCEYSNQQIIIRNLGCCPMCCGKSNFVISYPFLIYICVVRILLIYPIYFIVYTNLLNNQFDFMAHFLMIIVGITQGYIYNMVFSLTPQIVKKHRKEIVTSILRFFHFGGIAIGSIIALIVAYIVKYKHLNVDA